VVDMRDDCEIADVLRIHEWWLNLNSNRRFWRTRFDLARVVSRLGELSPQGTKYHQGHLDVSSFYSILI
jgi:hypothetical protein